MHVNHSRSTIPLSRRNFLRHSTFAAFGLTFGAPILTAKGINSVLGVKGELPSADIAIRTSQGTLPAFVAYPKGNGPFPAVIVCHDWYGLTDATKNAAQRLADAGFIAVAPNFYRSQVATDQNHAQLLAQNLRLGQAIDDIRNAANYLIHDEKATHVGLLTFAYGEGLAFAVAQTSLPIDQIAVLYGATSADPNAVNGDLLDIRLADIHSSMRFAPSRQFGPMIIGEFSSDVLTARDFVSADAWTRTLNWLKRDISI